MSALVQGALYPAVRSKDIAGFTFAFETVAQQNRIAAKVEELLCDLDAGVAELKAAQKKLAQHRQSLLKSALEGALTADWRKPTPHRKLVHNFLNEASTSAVLGGKQSTLPNSPNTARTHPRIGKKYPEPVQPDTTALPELPEGWVWASLDMLGEITSGVAKGSKMAADVEVREVPYLRVANVQRGFLDLSEVKTILATAHDIAELTLKDGDVLFNEGGDRDKLGRGWVWRNEVADCIHQNHVFGCGRTYRRYCLS